MAVTVITTRLTDRRKVRRIGDRGREGVMTRLKRCGCFTVLALVLTVASAASAQTQQIPISEYLAMDDYTGYYECFWNVTTPDVVVCLDTVGGRMAYFGLASSTTVDGSVTIRPLRDGRAQVTILLHAADAVCWAYDGMPVVFGATPRQAYLNPTLYEPLLSLGRGMFRWEFTMPSVDTPLPPLWMLWSDEFPVDSFVTEFHSKGLMAPPSGYPAGTSGMAQVTQRALFETGAPTDCPAGDCWPVEVAFYKATAP